MGESHTRNTGNNKTCNSLFRTILIPNPEVSKLKKKKLKTMMTVQSSKWNNGRHLCGKD